MVLVINPVIWLGNDPFPVPLIFLLFKIVGFGLVFQQIPREVTGDPPSLITTPPPVAVVSVVGLTSDVVIEGTVLKVVIVI